MLALPVNGDTFKRSFLDGNGRLELQTDNDVWKGLFTGGGVFKPNPGDVDQIADLRVGVGASKDVTLGTRGGLNLTFGGEFEAGNQIQLIWPRAKELDQFNLSLDDGQLYVRLVMGAKGNASAAGHFRAPAGVKVKFGLEAGGHASYELLKRFSAAETAQTILADLFRSVRLPQQIGTPDEIPAPGEVVIVRFGGYLGLSAGITWGYSLSGVKELDVPRLELAVDYALKVAASVNVGYRLAGDFELHASRGSADGWVRYVVRKSRDSELSFAADLGADLAVRLKGLPEGRKAADRFIAQVLGADAEAVLKALDKARTLSTLDALQKEVNRLGRTAVDKLAMVWLNKALDQDNVKEFFALVGKAVDEYEKVDTRIIQLYDEAIGRIPQLKSTLDRLAKVTPDSLKAILNDSLSDANKPLVDFVTRTWGDDVFDLLLEGEAFTRFQRFVADAQTFLGEGAHDHVKTLIETVKEELALDELVSRLKTLNDPAKLADERLKGLTEQLVGMSFERIKKSELPAALKKAHDTLEKIETFKNEWYAKITRAAEQNFNLTLGLAFSKARHDAALVDVEIDLNEEEGRRLAGAAARGDFVEILENYASSLVRVRRGRLDRALRSTTHTHINVMGWGFDRVVTLVQKPTHSIEAQPGGLMHVYATETSIEQISTRGGKYKETVATKFVLQTLGASLQSEKDPAPVIDPRTRQFLIQTLDKMAIEYDMSYDDERTKAEELTYYLQFANRLGMLPSVAVGGELTVSDMVRTLDQQFGGKLGHVKVKYVVRYDDDAVRSAFHLDGAALADVARAAYREFVSALYLSEAKNRSNNVAMGFACLSQDLANKAGRNELAGTQSVTVPGWFTGSGPRPLKIPQELLPQVQFFFNTERDLLENLEALDDVVDMLEANRKSDAPRPIPVDALDEAARDFVGLADETDHFGEGVFFAVVDALIQAGSAGKAARQSAMIFEIEPEGSTDVIRKVLTA